LGGSRRRTQWRRERGEVFATDQRELADEALGVRGADEGADQQSYGSAADRLNASTDASTTLRRSSTRSTPATEITASPASTTPRSRSRSTISTSAISVVWTSVTAARRTGTPATARSRARDTHPRRGHLA